MKITTDFLAQINSNRLYNITGIRIVEAEHGQAISRLDPPPEICWPFAHQPHGGVLFTLMDTTMAWAVVSSLDAGCNCTTINLNIDYISPAKEGPFTCSAWAAHQTKRTSFARADIHDANRALVAMGQAIFRILQMDVEV